MFPPNATIGFNLDIKAFEKALKALTDAMAGIGNASAATAGAMNSMASSTSSLIRRVDYCPTAALMYPGNRKVKVLQISDYDYTVAVCIDPSTATALPVEITIPTLNANGPARANAVQAITDAIMYDESWSWEGICNIFDSLYLNVPLEDILDVEEELDDE